MERRSSSRPHHGGSSTGSSSGKSNSNRTQRACRQCGQLHSHHEPHLYNYVGEVDEDLMCQICLQPFVLPIDTPCGHTFCHVCINNYIKVNPMCPLDRKPLTEMSCSPSNLVLKRLLDKLAVTCPNADSCEEQLQRGNLDDHLRYRCSGTLVACQYAASGCDFRGPTKSMAKHQTECRFKKEGITRLPVLEGEVSHVEIPRTSSALGITIVGGADTPLRCVVVQEVFPDGLIAQDGRLRPGDQIIEINGVDMTCATHAQVCAALRKMTSVLRLGVYRERIEKYNGRRSAEPATANNNKSSSTAAAAASAGVPASTSNSSRGNSAEEMLTVTLDRQAGKQLGIRLSGNQADPGIFIADIQEGSATALDGRIQKFDRLIFINGQDVRNAELSQASALIQNNDKVTLVVGRRKSSSSNHVAVDTVDNGSSSSSVKRNGHGSSIVSGSSNISHTRSKSAPAIQHKGYDSDDYIDDDDEEECSDLTDDGCEEVVTRPTQEESHQRRPRASTHSSSGKKNHVYDVPECNGGDDYMAIYETIDRKRNEAREMKNKSHSMEALETPTPSLKSFDMENGHQKQPRKRHRSKPQKEQQQHRRSVHDVAPQEQQQQTVQQQQNGRDYVDGHSMTSFLKKALRLEGPQLTQRTVTIKKNVRESLGMRIGGGIGSNEGDTPIYVANIHPHGCIGKSKQLKKGDLLLSVDGTSLCGLTHSQAVATLKATINHDQVVLGVMDGPETSFGASNFIPSWMYWQKMPRSLQYPKTVILHRRENASWGFSIVGGADTTGGRPTEPIHVLFVVPDSPAAKDAKLKCGDRLLAVDGQSLENIPHHVAVAMLKRTSTRVVTEVVSWMGTEL